MLSKVLDWAIAITVINLLVTMMIMTGFEVYKNITKDCLIAATRDRE